MKRTWVVVFVVFSLSCGTTPPENDGGASGDGGEHTGDGGEVGGGTGGGEVGGGTGGGEVGGGLGGGTGGGAGGGEVGGGLGGGTGGGTGGGGEVGGGTGGGTTTECTSGESRACCTTGVQRCSPAGTWDTCSVTSTQEVCNGVDDDCDGQVDDGARFTPEQLVDAGVAADGGCSVGIGACVRTGGVACSSTGGAVCGATPGAAGVETCNTIDDDCDGQVDEGLLLGCLPDEDNDRYATDNTSISMLCPDTTRSDFGNCPAGFVTPNASVAVDCAPNDAARFRTSNIRSDDDRDTYCSGASQPMCLGATAPTGQRFEMDCVADDCNDADATKWRLQRLRIDADNDTYCTAAVSTNVCTGTNTPAGYQRVIDCNTAIDCDDSSAARYQTLLVRADADNDGYCSAAGAVSQCTGATPASGYQLTANCNAENDCDETTSAKYRRVNLVRDGDGDAHCTGAPTPVCVGAAGTALGYLTPSACIDSTDCNDSSASTWRMVNLGRDQDNDGYCANGPLTSTCIGNTAPAGYQLTCQSTPDCKDTNAYANVSCTRTLLTNQQSKYCGSQPALETLRFTYSCGQGFSPTSATTERQYSTCLDGSCTLAPSFNFTGNGSYEDVVFGCEAFAIGHDDWKLSVTCTAL